MFFQLIFLLSEVRTDLTLQNLHSVTLDSQPGAARRRVEREHSEYYVAARRERSFQLLDVSPPVTGGGEEVKDGAVMPELVMGRRQFG